MSRSTKDLLKEARALTQSTAAAHGMSRMQGCPSFLVREQPEVAESQGFQVLEIVRAIGRADTAPADHLKDQKVRMAKALCAYVVDSPGVCENFFTPIEDTTPFDAVLGVLQETHSAALASALVDVLVTVVLQVGVGLDKLRRMLAMLIEDGQLQRFAYLLLKGLTRMAAEQSLSSSLHPASPLPPRDAAGSAPSPGSRTQARRRVAQFFVFDGVRGGLCLGREEAWAWTSGYAFETWLWWEEEGAEGEAVQVLRMLGESSKTGGGPRFAVDLLLFDHRLHVQTTQGATRSLFRCPLVLQPRRWVHVVLSHAKHGLLRRAEVDLWLDGQHASQQL
eukprot:2041610-Rhodomonas_salina.1